MMGRRLLQVAVGLLHSRVIKNPRLTIEELRGLLPDPSKARCSKLRYEFPRVDERISDETCNITYIKTGEHEELIIQVSGKIGLGLEFCVSELEHYFFLDSPSSVTVSDLLPNAQLNHVLALRNRVLEALKQKGF
jgi:hypothetical protein